MALFWAYKPEEDEFEVLVPAESEPTFAEVQRRRDVLTVGYSALQSYCSRTPDADRYLTGELASELVDGEDWVLEALLRRLPSRPPLLHKPGGPGTMCSVDDCLDRCPDDECDCSIGFWKSGFDYRLCLLGDQPQ